MKTKFLSPGILGASLIVSSLIVANGAFAQTTTIQYPVAELGNCKNKESCKAYCDNPSNIDACVTFAEKNGIMSPEQLAEAKQVQAAIAKGIKPPACNGKKECDAYCEDSSHMKECITFGEASGFLKGKELEDAKKMIIAIDNGAKPPPCKGKEACDAYCSEGDHMEECITFSQAAGFMSPEETENSQKMLKAIRQGVKPPNCKGKDECDAYCSDPEHSSECIEFSVAAGFMTKEESEMAKRTGGKGPGDCKNKDECEAFCNNPDNQKTCMNFAKDNGLISKEDAQRMEEGQQKFKESMQSLPNEVEECMKTSLGSDSFENIKNGQTMPPEDMPEKIDSCFSNFVPPQGEPGSGGDMPPREQQGQQEQGKIFVPRTESGDQMQGEGQQYPSVQYEPGTYPNQPPQGEQPVPNVYMEQQQQQGTKGMQYEPGTYQNQQTQQIEQQQFAPGTFQNQQTQQTQQIEQQQFAPGTQPMMPMSGGGESPAVPPPTPSTEPGAGGEIAPGVPVPQAQPIEQQSVEPTTSQSSNFSLSSLLANAATALKELGF